MLKVNTIQWVNVKSLGACVVTFLRFSGSCCSKDSVQHYADWAIQTQTLHTSFWEGEVVADAIDVKVHCS